MLSKFPSTLLTGVFNVDFCLYGTYIHMLVCMSQVEQLAQWVTHIIHLYCHHEHQLSCPIPYSVSFIAQVCLTVRPCLSDMNRGRGKHWPLRLRTKEPPHFTTYTLLPRSHLPYNVLHSPSKWCVVM